MYLSSASHLKKFSPLLSSGNFFPFGSLIVNSGDGLRYSSGANYPAQICLHVTSE